MISRLLVVSATSLLLLSACGGENIKPDDTGSTSIGGQDNVSKVEGPAAVENVDDLGQFGYGEGNGITDAQTGVESAFAGLNDPTSPLYTRIIYFNYNATDIAEEYKIALDAHAQLLADNPDVRFRLEGHTDERGSREYNIGLGNRRAVAVERYLQERGVSSEQVETVSYGEEKPARLEHNDAAWQLNRRVELVYLGY